jgi:hypothetical protein
MEGSSKRSRPSSDLSSKMADLSSFVDKIEEERNTFETSLLRVERERDVLQTSLLRVKEEKDVLEERISEMSYKCENFDTVEIDAASWCCWIWHRYLPFNRGNPRQPGTF